MIVTLIAARGLSQPFTVWLTYQVVVPGAVVEGVGAVTLPVPPVGAVYQRRLLPVAVSGTAVASWQYVTGLVTVGAAGKGLTVRFNVVTESQPLAEAKVSL